MFLSPSLPLSLKINKWNLKNKKVLRLISDVCREHGVGGCSMSATDFHLLHLFIYLLFKKYFIYLFSERGREGEREGEKHQCVVASHALHTGDLASNQGMCPAWESNRQPFGSQVRTQSIEPHQPGRDSMAHCSTANFLVSIKSTH